MAISLDIAIKSTCLTLIHKDPADRFIIASALIHNMPVVTKDEKFNVYGVRVIS